MKGKSSFILFLLALLIVGFTGCKSDKAKSDHTPLNNQEIAEEAIKTWITRSNEYPHYKPIVFGDLTPRYNRSSNTLSLSIQIADEEDISRKTGDTKKLDSLRNEIAKHKRDLMGYLIPHKFQEMNMAGETIIRELLFFLDTNLRIASALPPESFDFILDESIFFRPDTFNN
jgi:hypothetical protein